MIVGQQFENKVDKDKRHREELEKDIICFKRELEYAINKNDKEYEKHCCIMIELYESEIKKLNIL